MVLADSLNKIGVGSQVSGRHVQSSESGLESSIKRHEDGALEVLVVEEGSRANGLEGASKELQHVGNRWSRCDLVDEWPNVMLLQKHV